MLKQNNALVAFGPAAAALPAPGPCIRCGNCINACPMGLSPVEIAGAYTKNDGEMLDKQMVDLCIGCGTCSYVCPAKRPVTQTMNLAKPCGRKIRTEGRNNDGKQKTDRYRVPPYHQPYQHAGAYAQRVVSRCCPHWWQHAYFRRAGTVVTGVTVAACVGFEALYCVVMKKPVPVGDFSAVVTGMILAFKPARDHSAVDRHHRRFRRHRGGKAAVRRSGLQFCKSRPVGTHRVFIGFAGRMTAYAFPQTDIEALASATPLVAGNSMAGKDMLLQLLLGAHARIGRRPAPWRLFWAAFT